MKFTRQQLNNWRRYEIIRTSGFQNMISDDARISSGLSVEEYKFVQDNYSDLKAKARGSISCQD